MLGLSTHEPHFFVIRERMTGGSNQVKQKKLGKFDYNLGERVAIEEPNSKGLNFNIPFTFVKIYMVRFFLENYMNNIHLSFGFNLENIIDDFVLLCFLVGNDFLPHIPGFNIRVGGIDILLSFYKKTLGTLDGYLTHNCDVNLSNLERFFVKLSRCEFALLRKLEMTEAGWVS